MAALPTTVLRVNDFHVDAKRPCRFVFLIPLKLPPLLDPSIPPPPYRESSFLNTPRMWNPFLLALRPAIAGVLYNLLGTEAPVSAMIPHENRHGQQREESSSETVQDPHRPLHPDNEFPNPLVIEIQAMPILHKGKVACIAQSYNPAMQREFNFQIWRNECP
ncbi:hypothetical protein N0V88_000170 [Collariella sp. IMI 366227]|nr:hypothetical protein N0V88_000170 [Collariella sp. IMI 366227]